MLPEQAERLKRKSRMPGEGLRLCVYGKEESQKRSGSEINVGIVVAALEQLLHLFLAGMTRVRAGAGVADGVFRDLGQTLEEHILRHKALLRGVESGP